MKIEKLSGSISNPKPRPRQPILTTHQQGVLGRSFVCIVGILLLFVLIASMHSCMTQYEAENKAERRAYVERENIRRTYDPTKKERKEDIRAIVKRMAPDSYKDQVVYERNLKDFYGIE